MKKKIVALIVLVCVFATLFTGCTFIKINEERQANETIVTVTYKDISLNVTRNELMMTINSTLSSNYSYYQQNGMSLDAEMIKSLADSSLSGLINRKYIVIQSIYALREYEARKGKTIADTNAAMANTPVGALTYAEKAFAIRAINTSLKGRIDEYVADYNSEMKNTQIAEAKTSLEEYYENGYSVDHVEFKKDSFKSRYMVGEELDDEKAFLLIYLKKDDVVLETPVETRISNAMYTTEPTTTLTDTENKKSGVYEFEKEVVAVYDEPIEGTDEETGEKTTKYESHEAKATFKVIKLRTSVVAETDDEKEEREDGYLDDVRYMSKEQFDEYFKTTPDTGIELSEFEYFDYSTDKAKTQAEKEAYRQFVQFYKSSLIQFEENEKNYPNEGKGLYFFYKDQFESAVLNAMMFELAKGADATAKKNAITDAEIANEYATLVNQAKAKYDVMANDAARVQAFQSTITSDLSTLYYIPAEALENEGYTLKDFYYNTHILFPFNEEQLAFIAKNSTLGSEKLSRTDTYNYDVYLSATENSKTVKANPDYDADYVCPKHSEHTDGAECNYTGEGDICPACAFYENADGSFKKYDVFGESGVLKELTAALDAVSTANEKMEVFNKFRAYYNADNGNSEYTTGYLINPIDIANGYASEDFMTHPQDIYSAFSNNGANKVEKGSYTKNGDYITYSFTTYGIHVQILSFLPFENVELKDAEGKYITNMTLDTVVDLTGKTLREVVKETMTERIETDAFTAFSEGFTTEIAKNSSKLNEKKLKKIYEEFGLTYGEEKSK